MSSAGDTPSPAAGRNRFLVWPADAPSPVPFDPEEPPAGGEASDLRYFFGVARALARLLGDRGLTFLLTWHLDRFDDRLRGAVVLLVGDEMYQTPSYGPAVRAVFKTGGCARNPLGDTLRLAPSLAARVLLRELRNVLLVRRRRSSRAGRPAPMFELPLGYFGLTDQPFIPVAERPTDVFFAGSIEASGGFTLRPRLVARRQMLAGLTLAQRRLPALRVDCTRAGPFANPGGMLSGDVYSARLMRAKIALCPRGNFDETFRLMEAARSGSVAIVDSLPRRWYNRDSPAVVIDRWSSLPDVLSELLADEPALTRRSEQMRAWWAESLSEGAVAEFMVRQLNGDRGGQAVVGA